MEHSTSTRFAPRTSCLNTLKGLHLLCETAQLARVASTSPNGMYVIMFNARSRSFGLLVTGRLRYGTVSASQNYVLTEFLLAVVYEAFTVNSIREMYIRVCGFRGRKQPTWAIDYAGEHHRQSPAEIIFRQHPHMPLCPVIAYFLTHPAGNSVHAYTVVTPMQ